MVYLAKMVVGFIFYDVVRCWWNVWWQSVLTRNPMDSPGTSQTMSSCHEVGSNLDKNHRARN